VDLLGELEAIEFRLVVYILSTSRRSERDGPKANLEQGFGRVHEAAWGVAGKYVQEVYEALDMNTSSKVGALGAGTISSICS
jgi:hypothetical protein